MATPILSGPVSGRPYLPPLFSDRATAQTPITELYFARARKQLSKRGDDPKVKAILKEVFGYQDEYAKVEKQCAQFGRAAARVRWNVEMLAAVEKLDGREVPNKSKYVEAELRRLRPLKAGLVNLSKQATPAAIRLAEMLIVAFQELATERGQEEKDFAGGGDFIPSLLLQGYSYAAKNYLPNHIKRLTDTPANRKPVSFLFGITS